MTTARELRRNIYFNRLSYLSLSLEDKYKLIPYIQTLILSNKLNDGEIKDALNYIDMDDLDDLIIIDIIKYDNLPEHIKTRYDIYINIKNNNIMYDKLY